MGREQFELSSSPAHLLGLSVSSPAVMETTESGMDTPISSRTRTSSARKQPKVAIHSFMSIFQLILLDPPKLIIALANLVNNPISPIKSLNQMSNSKITSFKLPRTDYHPTCIGDIFPYPLFQTSEFS